MSSDSLIWIGIVVGVCLLGAALGGAVVRCQHDNGQCEHVVEREEVEAILHCFENLGD